MRYEMTNDARARAVAKELAQLAKEMGYKLSLTGAQKTTSRMLGYDSWHMMQMSKGTIQGPEDNQLTSEQLESRKAMQVAALLEVGITEEDAKHIVKRLRPTEKTSDAISLDKRVHFVQGMNVYHPNRLRKVIYLAQSQLQYWDGYVSSIEQEYEEWADGRPLARLDDMARKKGEPFQYLVDSLGDVEETGYIVDVAGLVDTMQDDVLSEGWESMPPDPAGLTGYFLHFGPHRLPSPFRGIGVDGCYVKIWESADGPGAPPDDVSFTFTTSEEFDRDNPDVVPDCDYMLSVRSVLRVVSVGFGPCEGETLQSAIDTEARDYMPEEYLDRWRPYLPKLLNVAWNSLRVYRARRFGLSEAVLSDVDHRLVEKLERAGSEASVQKALKRIAERETDVPVRFMGRTPPAGETFDELLASPYPRADSGLRPGPEDLDALLADVVETAHPWGMYYVARRALRMAEELFFPGSAERLLRAKALFMNAAFNVEKPEAEECALYVLGSGLPQAAEYLPGAFIVFASLIMEEQATQALSKLQASRPGKPMTVWCAALYAAIFDEEGALGPALKAVGMDLRTARKVMEMDVSPWSWFFRTDGYEDRQDELDHAACMTAELFFTSECRGPIAKALEMEARGGMIH